MLEQEQGQPETDKKIQARERPPFSASSVTARAKEKPIQSRLKEAADSTKVVMTNMSSKTLSVRLKTEKEKSAVNVNTSKSSAIVKRDPVQSKQVKQAGFGSRKTLPPIKAAKSMTLTSVMPKDLSNQAISHQEQCLVVSSDSDSDLGSESCDEDFLFMPGSKFKSQEDVTLEQASPVTQKDVSMISVQVTNQENCVTIDTEKNLSENSEQSQFESVHERVKSQEDLVYCSQPSSSIVASADNIEITSSSSSTTNAQLWVQENQMVSFQPPSASYSCTAIVPSSTGEARIIDQNLEQGEVEQQSLPVSMISVARDQETVSNISNETSEDVVFQARLTSNNSAQSDGVNNEEEMPCLVCAIDSNRALEESLGKGSDKALMSMECITSQEDKIAQTNVNEVIQVAKSFTETLHELGSIEYESGTSQVATETSEVSQHVGHDKEPSAGISSITSVLTEKSRVNDIIRETPLNQNELTCSVEARDQVQDEVIVKTYETKSQDHDVTSTDDAETSVKAADQTVPQFLENAPLLSLEKGDLEVKTTSVNAVKGDINVNVQVLNVICNTLCLCKSAVCSLLD